MLQKSKHESNVVAQRKSLSIQFSLDGFSFCVEDLLTKKSISFTKYTFDTTLNTPEILLEKTQQIFHQDKDLQNDFESINVIHQNSLSTLVPNDYFNENNLKNYLDYNIKTLANDYITYDTITSINAKNVYIPFVNINNYLFQNFGEFEFNHHSTILINKLIDYSNKNTRNGFFVNVSTKNLDIVVIQESNLVLYNTFSYKTKEDFIYYILFVAEQLGLDTNEFNLTFLGDIEPDNEKYKMTFDYIRNIDFIETSNTFFNTSDDFSNHSNYILIS